MKVALEQAEQEFNQWAEAMDLDLDETLMDEDDMRGFMRQKKRILKAVQNGSLVFNDDHEAVFTPQHRNSKTKDPITFHERTGASLMAVDRKKKGHDVARMYAVLADMCNTAPQTFAGLAGEDVKVCEALFALLMD